MTNRIKTTVNVLFAVKAGSLANILALAIGEGV